MQYPATSVLKGSAGSILWLPSRSDIATEYSSAIKDFDEGCFNHPVLVLATNSAKTEVVVLMVTSFAGTDLKDRHPTNLKTRALYIPIDPSNPHPDNGSLLHLKGAARLRKKSYINIQPRGPFKAALLRSLQQPPCMLKKDSLKALIEQINFTSPWKVTVIVPAAVPRTDVPTNRSPLPAAYYIPAAAIATQPARLNHISQASNTPPAQTPQPSLNRQLSSDSNWNYGTSWATYQAMNTNTTIPTWPIHSNERTPLLPTSSRQSRAFTTSQRYGHKDRDESGSSPARVFGITTLVAALVFVVYHWNLFKFRT